MPAHGYRGSGRAPTDARGDSRGACAPRRPDPDDARPAAAGTGGRGRVRSRHPGVPEARTVPAHGQLQGARRPGERACPDRGRARARHLRDQRRKPRDCRRIRRARRRHERQGRDEGGCQRLPGRRMPSIRRRGRFRAGFPRGVPPGGGNPPKRRPHADASLRGAAHRPGYGHPRASSSSNRFRTSRP